MDLRCKLGTIADSVHTLAGTIADSVHTLSDTVESSARTRNPSAMALASADLLLQKGLPDDYYEEEADRVIDLLREFYADAVHPTEVLNSLGRLYYQKAQYHRTQELAGDAAQVCPAAEHAELKIESANEALGFFEEGIQRASSRGETDAAENFRNNRRSVMTYCTPNGIPLTRRII
jgi:hypothetical protein